MRDVLVVGGGPAGSATAAFLAADGHDVLLLDAALFPRDKVCGESVSPQAWRLLDRMGASARLSSLGPWPIRGMRLVSPAAAEFRGHYRDRERAGFALRRSELDVELLACARAAGAEVLEGTRVSAPLRDGTGVAGVRLADDSTVRARIVVAADGRRSVIARGLGLLREHPRLRRFAVRGYWSGMQELEELGEMHVAPGAYCGIAPLSATTANVAFVLDASALLAAGGDLEGFYGRTLGERWPAIARRLASAEPCGPPAAVGPLALDCRAVSAPGVVLVGDAAGFFDPFTGEGITLALRSAELAAEAIHDALLRSPAGRTPLGRLLEYERARERATRDKFRFNRLLQLAVERPWLADSVARRLSRRPDLADRLVGIAGDFVPARTAFGARFLLDLLLA